MRERLQELRSMLKGAPAMSENKLREALAGLCLSWETEKETENPTERSKWYEMALLRCAREVRGILKDAALAAETQPAPPADEVAQLVAAGREAANLREEEIRECVLTEALTKFSASYHAEMMVSRDRYAATGKGLEAIRALKLAPAPAQQEMGLNVPPNGGQVSKAKFRVGQVVVVKEALINSEYRVAEGTLCRIKERGFNYLNLIVFLCEFGSVQSWVPDYKLRPLTKRERGK